jgi:Kef-type K+ transport system membrane component KefB
MTDLPLLRDLGLILGAAAAVALMARAIRVPSIPAYMVAGMVVGPLTGLIPETDSLELISEAGIALLLFLVGLELSLHKIREVGRVALLAGAAQIALTSLLGLGLGLALGFDAAGSAVLALGLTFSSTVVVVKLLDQRGELDATHGRIAVGILLVQDVAVAVALAVLAGLEAPVVTGVEAPVSLGVETVGRGLLRASVGMVALVVGAALAVRSVLPVVFRWLGGSLEALFVWSLTWCFGFILAAQGLGLSVEIGAFVAGVGLAQLPYGRELVRRVHPLVNFFLAVFFVSAGIHMHAAEALARWPAVVALSVFVLIGKPAILMALIPRFGYGQRTSFLASLTLGQISEFSLIVAALAASAGLVDATFTAVVGLVGLITIGISSILIQSGDRLYRRLEPSTLLGMFRAPLAAEPPPEPELRDHVIVVGLNSLGRRLVVELHRRGESVLAVDTDAAKLRRVPGERLQGSIEHPAVLEEAGLEHAKLLISALQIEETNNLLAYRTRQAGIPSSIHAFDATLADELRDHGATHVMVSKFDGIRRVAEELRRLGALP